MAISRKSLFCLLAGVCLVGSWLVAGGVFDSVEPLLEAAPLGLLGAAFFAFGHV